MIILKLKLILKDAINWLLPEFDNPPTWYKRLKIRLIPYHYELVQVGWAEPFTDEDEEKIREYLYNRFVLERHDNESI